MKYNISDSIIEFLPETQMGGPWIGKVKINDILLNEFFVYQPFKFDEEEKNFS